jgi:polyhydroxybutyrate depolymerase
MSVLSVAAGCGVRSTDDTSDTSAPRSPVPVGSSGHWIAAGGRDRTFLVYRPSSLPASTPVPLVVMIHGGGGSAAGAESKYGWDRLADQNKFVVAYPDGVGRSWNGGGGCCGAAGRTAVDDVGFLNAMITRIGQSIPIDPNRQFATGISDGGIMAYRLACDSPALAAIGPDAATQVGPCPKPAPLSLIHVHGSDDPRVPIDGRPGAGVNHITGGRSIAALVAGWRGIDDCPPPSVSTHGALVTTTSRCPLGRAVTLIVVTGGGHEWPGSPGRTDGPADSAFDATSVIWQFFAAHPRVAAHPTAERGLRPTAERDQHTADQGSR